jgi:hypothetical protein
MNGHHMRTSAMGPRGSEGRGREERECGGLPLGAVLQKEGAVLQREGG